MKGTEKQIEWAEKIKAEKMQSLRAEKILSTATQLAAFYTEMINTIDMKDQATYWINRKNQKGFELIQELVKSDAATMARYQAAKQA